VTCLQQLLHRFKTKVVRAMNYSARYQDELYRATMCLGFTAYITAVLARDCFGPPFNRRTWTITLFITSKIRQYRPI
jgi:hypothetical protein